MLSRVPLLLLLFALLPTPLYNPVFHRRRVASAAILRVPECMWCVVNGSCHVGSIDATMQVKKVM